MGTSQGTYAMGGDDDSTSRNEVLKLECPGDQIQCCQWIEMDEKLQFSRDTVSISIPESHDICND